MRTGFFTIIIFYAVSQIFETALVCADPGVYSDPTWKIILLIKTEIVIVIGLVINTYTAILVLPKMRKDLGCQSITVSSLFMLVEFEIIMLYRMYINGFQ